MILNNIFIIDIMIMWHTFTQDTIPCMGGPNGRHVYGSGFVDLRHGGHPLSHDIKPQVQIQRQRKRVLRSTRTNPVAYPKGLQAFTLAHHVYSHECLDAFNFTYFIDIALCAIFI